MYYTPPKNRNREHNGAKNLRRLRWAGWVSLALCLFWVAAVAPRPLLCRAGTLPLAAASLPFELSLSSVSSECAPSTLAAEVGSGPAFAVYVGEETETILAAARRNGLGDEQTILLFAIRKAENGPAGREFGVMAAGAIDTNLDTQAGWAAATIARNRQRYLDASGWAADAADALTDAHLIGPGQKVGVSRSVIGGNPCGTPAALGDDFVGFLADRYCPAAADSEGNRNWKHNVRWWLEKLSIQEYRNTGIQE